MARQRVWKRNKIDFSQQMQTCTPLQIQILCVPLKLEKWVPLRTKAEEGHQTSDFRLPTSDFRLPTSDFRLPTSDFRLQTSDFRLPTSDFRLPTSDFRLQTSDFRLPTSDFRLQTSDFRLQTSDFRLPKRLPTDFRLENVICLHRLPYVVYGAATREPLKFCSDEYVFERFTSFV